MFSPNDVGLPYPLTYKMYHGRYVICDAMGHELYLTELIRPSLEAKRWIGEWADINCKALNWIHSIFGHVNIDKLPSVEVMKNLISTVEDIATEEKRPIELPIKRGRGRPRKK